MQAIAKEAQHQIRHFKPQELANTVWAFATLNIQNASLVEAIAKEALHKIHHFNPQELVNTAWAFMILEMFKNLELVEIFNKELIKKDSVNFNLKCQSQLYQISKWLELNGHSELAIIKHFNEQKIIEAFKTISQSELQKRVSNCLKKGAYIFEEEYFDKTTGHSIDIAFISQKIAIEIDGPAHYVSHSQKLLGKTVLRNRLLEKANWKLIVLPYWELNRMQSEKDLEQYLMHEIFLKPIKKANSKLRKIEFFSEPRSGNNGEAMTVPSRW